jgi:hypothetical protein
LQISSRDANAYRIEKLLRKNVGPIPNNVDQYLRRKTVLFMGKPLQIFSLNPKR